LPIIRTCGFDVACQPDVHRQVEPLQWVGGAPPHLQHSRLGIRHTGTVRGELVRASTLDVCAQPGGSNVAEVRSNSVLQKSPLGTPTLEIRDYIRVQARVARADAFGAP